LVEQKQVNKYNQQIFQQQYATLAIFFIGCREEQSVELNHYSLNPIAFIYHLVEFMNSILGPGKSTPNIQPTSSQLF